MPKKKKRERMLVDGAWHTKKSNGKPGVALPRNDGWWTESEFFNRISAALRDVTKWWKPKLRYLEDGSRPYKGKDKRIKKEYQCEECLKWFVRDKIQMDHIEPVGKLRSFDDLPGVCRRLYLEYEEGWQRLCKACHNTKTNLERKKL